MKTLCIGISKLMFLLVILAFLLVILMKVKILKKILDILLLWRFRAMF